MKTRLLTPDQYISALLDEIMALRQTKLVRESGVSYERFRYRGCCGLYRTLAGDTFDDDLWTRQLRNSVTKTRLHLGFTRPYYKKGAIHSPLEHFLYHCQELDVRLNIISYLRGDVNYLPPLEKYVQDYFENPALPMPEYEDTIFRIKNK